MRDDLRRLRARQAVVHGPVQVVGNLGDLAGRDQGADRDQAPVPGGEVGTQPQVAEQRVRRELVETGSHGTHVLSDAGRALFSVFGIAILGLVVLAVRSTPGLTGVAIVLGAPATVLLLMQAVTGDDALLPFKSGLFHVARSGPAFA